MEVWQMQVVRDRRLLAQTIITAIALVLVLVYNFFHTGGLLAS